ncbi:indoleamine 2,3-dioxygenase [Geosmithia morbida]|uniref:Indoleamine 2,3-dioxygenase n=1 Tax=Geosmithia morbida TaxID=1094350 RepID=A0A9P4Z062_9HYPO|nr:indoleamine 2,3-dioxygenase [Geosmithia morbida]KAF4126278.1 indoleamine 2,3-dioxygenase [Geosmithia morbida]
MGSLGTTANAATTHSFHVLDDPRPHDKSLPAFMVSKARGFLPRADPIVTLPDEFSALESILQRMPVKTACGEPGLLAQYKLGDEIDGGLFPNLAAEMDAYRDDLPVMNALYRDYSFLASAYLLEPCHHRFIKGEPYGLGRQVLPAYPKKGMEYSNLRLIRAFENGLDPTSSEAGFVLVHVDMVKNSGALVSGVMQCLDAAAAAADAGNDAERDTGATTGRRTRLNAGLESVLAALRKINAVMETMWGKSSPMAYTSFRTFIFGITSQSMFPDGVVYEGLNDGKPLSFRGESGANDSMVPLMDNLLQVPMPDTPLTEILRDFREYRPSNHKGFLLFVRERSLELKLREYALGLDGDGADDGDGDDDDGTRDLLRASRSLWIQVLDQVRDFRWRHWCFAREYILKRTSHPTATGGSPIVTWLPNQLRAVLDDMADVHARSKARHPEGLGPTAERVMEIAIRQRDSLRKEVDKYCAERGVNRS